MAYLQVRIALFPRVTRKITDAEEKPNPRWLFLKNGFNTTKLNESMSTAQVKLHRRSGERRLVGFSCDFIECLATVIKMICIKFDLQHKVASTP